LVNDSKWIDYGAGARRDDPCHPVAAPVPARQSERRYSRQTVITRVIRELYDYNAWANSRILDTAIALTPAQLVAPGGASFESVRDTLVHTMGAQWLYLERWNGRSPRALPEPATFPDLAAIQARWGAIERDTQAFLAGLDDTRLAADRAYTNTQGETWTYPLWQQMIHQVNHATQHRSEAAVLLTKMGHSPGWLDLLYFVDLRNASTL
jgi:uncharacterized damage-inducible protein DinB